MCLLSETVFNKFEMSIVLLLYLFIRVVWIDGDKVVNEAIDGVGYFLGGHVCIAAAEEFLRLLAFSKASLSRGACNRRGKGDYRPLAELTFTRRDTGTRAGGGRWDVSSLGEGTSDKRRRGKLAVTPGIATLTASVLPAAPVSRQNLDFTPPTDNFPCVDPRRVVINDLPAECPGHRSDFRIVIA